MQPVKPSTPTQNKKDTFTYNFLRFALYYCLK